MIQQHGGMTDGGSSSADWTTDEWALRLGAIFVLVFLAAMFSGLTLGLMSLDKVGLEVVIATGEEATATEEERRNAKYAKKIQPIRHDGHLLLTTLLFGNVAVNSIMAILMADMTSGFVGFIVSTIILVIFGEVIPQALCSKHPLAIGAKALPLIYVLIGVMYIIAKPIALVLDYFVGHDMGTVFSRCELEKMLDIHVKQKKLDEDELGIMRGAMHYKQTPVSSVMTPIADVFTLPGSTRLDLQMIEKIYSMGYTRVPVWGKDVNDVLGIIFVKDLIFVDPEARDKTTLLDFLHLFGRSVHRVWPDSTLGDVLEAFKVGRTHLAIVHEVNNWSKTDPFYETQGVVTLEDIVEEILQDEIYDEQDVANSPMHQRNTRMAHPSFDTGVRHIIDNNTEFKSITEPEAMALAKHLVATQAVFRVPDASGLPLTPESVAGLLMRSPIVEYNNEHPKLYEANVVANHCLVVMQGEVAITSQEATSLGTAGLWTVLGVNSLIQVDGDYRSDVTVTIPCDYLRCLRISRLEFQKMLRPVSLSKKHSVLNTRRRESIQKINQNPPPRRGKKEDSVRHAVSYV
ncbi:unnamed protein product [Aphanomyces euteiches]